MEPHRRSPPTPPLLSPNSPPKYPVNSIPQKQGAVLFLDENGNPVRIDSTWYSSHYSALEIDFDAFELIGQSRSIADADAVDVATINDIDTATINIFPFLDQVYSNIAAGTEDPISFAFLFTFATPVNQSTVDIDDFNISLVDSSGSSTRLDSNNDNITFTFTDYSTGGETSSTLRYDLVDTAATNITFNSDSTVITISFPLEDDMLYYGFDIEDQLAVALDPANDIASATGIALGSGSDPLAYIVQAQMPLLTEFLFVDPTTDTASPDAVETNQYSTHSYSELPALPEDYEAYYGFRLRYGFHEPINSATGYLGTTSYDYPDHGSYLQGAGTSTLLTHAKTDTGPLPSDLPITNTTAYTTFFVDGSLVHPQDPDANTTWDHLAYLGADQADFDEDTAEHSFTILASQSYDYMDGSLSTTYENTLPILLGGYDPSAFYTPATKLEANFFLDAYGNPARVASAWLLEPTVEGNSTLAITYDRSRPNLLSASAFNIADTDDDGNVDNFTGSFGEFSDQATFEFALTFDREMDQLSLASGIFWDVDTNSTAGLGTPTPSVSAVNISDTDYIYTFTYAIDEGLYAAAGTYTIAFDENTLATDTKTNPIDPAAANQTLQNTLCLAGTCQFLNNPVSLEAATVDPSGAVIVDPNTSYAAAFNVTLTFSEPVTFTADISQRVNVEVAFDLTYVDEDGNDIPSADDSTYTGANIAGLEPVAASATSIDGSTYYTEYQLSIEDVSEFWVRDDYLTEIGKINSFAYIFFEDLADELGIGAFFTDRFVTADGAQVTIPSAIQDGDADSGTSTIEYLLLADFEPPTLASASPVAASSDDNIQGDASNLRHVQFQLQGTDSSNRIGMLFLFRTTDDQFTHTQADTAPYYGAEGGIYIDTDTGYHICPPFNKHIERTSSGMQHPDAPSYNATRGKIHYLAIPYTDSIDAYLVDPSDIETYQHTTVDFTGNLPSTEPCVRSVFYNDGAGQYGYIVDSDKEEQHMVIANAMLQDANGSQADLAMLDPDQLHNVYFDLYSKDYTADSWRKDHKITAQDLIDQLTAANLNSDSLHNDDSGISYSLNSDYLSIFASRFVNTINARFLDSVFLDDLTMSDIPLFTQNELDKAEEIISSPYYDDHQRPNESAYKKIAVEDDYFTPNFRNQTPDNLALTNDNRLVLSIGVHPAAIQVNAGNGSFQPFESDQANFLKMDPEFYGLYYGGVAGTTEPAFDYTSRHLAYVNFDLVYELDIDPATQEITRANLVQIVSPFSLLKHSFFSAEELQARNDNFETYSAVAASIADNVFRHNFTGAESSSTVQHFLPYGVYCYNPINTSSSCYNSKAQMLLPNPDDSANGYQRTEPSLHNLHRGVLYLENTTNYSTDGDSANDSLGAGRPDFPDLLERFMRLNNGTSANSTDYISASSNPVAPGFIGSYAYHSMLYNSFDRDHAYDYSYSSSFEDFAAKIDRDNDYSSNDGFEQEYWGVAPYAESPDARADQILPNAFMLGFNGATDYHHLLTNQPYQYTSFVQKIHPNLTDADKLVDKNVALRGLDYDVGQNNSDQSWSGAGSLNLYPSYTFPASGVVTGASSTAYTYNTSATNLSTALSYRGSTSWVSSPEFAHVLGAPANARHTTAWYDVYDTSNIDTSITYGVYLSHLVPVHFAGRTPGFFYSRRNNGISFNAYAVQEFMLPIFKTGEGKTGLVYRADYGSLLDTRLNYAYHEALVSGDKTHYAAEIYDDYYYSGNQGRQRMIMPHHADDFDFDRGQIMAHKLGFFVDNGIAMDLVPSTNSTSGTFYGQAYNRMFFPSDPAAITSATSDTGYVVESFNSNAHGTVTNYYPLVQANESLHTNSGVWPVLLTRIELQHRYNFDNIDPSHLNEMSGYSASLSTSYINSSIVYESLAPVILPLSLDKIFPESYRYQLGFVNREELFMYDPTWDGSGDPVINRFYSSAVGHFGYATQYSRLNRRSMQGYHLSTSSQFFGDHLARFSSTPTAGVHTPSDLDSVFDHTPAQQGGTGTNYGSYGEGHYDLTTSADSQLSGGNWQHRTYDGTLRGYVLELRTNPFTDSLYDSYSSTDNDYPTTSDNGISYFGVYDRSTAGEHPDGDPED